MDITTQENCQSLITRILDLEEIDEDIFRGRTELQPVNNRVFGGQVIGQALHAGCYNYISPNTANQIAASKTVPREFMVHSLHAYFIRGGDPSRPILYAVSRTRNGASFTNRSVRAIQKGEVIFTMSASFHKPEKGLQHQAAVKPDAPDPETLPSYQQRQIQLANDPRVPQRVREVLKTRSELPIPIDVRPVDPFDILNPQKKDPSQLTWMKAIGPLSDDPRAHQIVAAYCSDYPLVGTLLLPHGMLPSDRRLVSASLDHSMYFHQPFRTDEWLLYHLNSTVASAGRGLAFGRFFDSKGNLVCSTVQEGLIRLRDDRPKKPNPDAPTPAKL